ncbi:MAG TPA: outer membrane protein assembly factor BamA [Dongiaceae bacterium]|nr:outer membrane protein assembly factor BamA [Dongiaceae bacterium]
MKSLLRRSGLLALVFLLSAFAATAQLAPTTVARIDIKHVGPAKVSDELIRANIRVRVGDPYVRSAVDDDVKNLYGTGFFYNIQVTDDYTDQGVVLTYIIQGKPRLTSINFEGNKKFSVSKLSKKVTSKVGQPLDEQKLFSDVQEIKKMYLNAGYPQTEVKYTVSIDENMGTGSATFEIKESPKVKIESIHFVGNAAFPESKLRKIVKIHKPGLFGSLFGWRTFKQDKLTEGKEKLYDFYREKGYLDFDIQDVQLTYPNPARVDIKIIITEGKQYRIGKITFEGTTFLPTNAISPTFDPGPKPDKNSPNYATWVEETRLHRGFPMKVGTLFTPNGMDADIDAIENFYGARGYIDVTRSSRNLQVLRVPNVETGTIDLEFQIDEGQKNYIEKIDIRGNVKTKDKVIRRELSVTPGEVFDMTRVKLSRTRLDNMQYFSKVEARPEPTDVPNRKNLVIDLEEKSTGNFSVGAGFSSVDSIVGFAEVTQGNFDLFNPPTFTGGGQKFRTRIQLGTQRQDYEISFTEPWFLGHKLALGVDLYRRELDFQSVNSLYNEQRTGARVSLTRALGSDFLIGSVSTTVEDAGIVDVPYYAPPSILDEAGNKILFRFGGSLAYDTRNSTRLPDHGQRTELDAEVVTGDAQFYKLELSTDWYFKGPFDGHVLEMVAKAGVVSSLGSGNVPFYERFYLGGLKTLRGYEYRGVGPEESYMYPDVTYDTNGLPVSTNSITAYEPVGGNTYWFASAEYSLPLIERLRFATFYDIGMVYPDSYSFSSSGSTGFADDIGIGLRIDLPIGPLRLDYGIPINHDKNTGGSGRFQFGVGYTRDF